MYRCCQLNYLMQIMSENLFRQYHRRKASTALNLFHVCYRKRLISKEKFMLNPLYTFPKKYELSTDINSLYNQMNQDWEIDFTPSPSFLESMLVLSYSFGDIVLYISEKGVTHERSLSCIVCC